uniref:Uncharacterized protein n=1 Tax=Amicula sp. isolate GU52X-4 cfCalB7 TaxID=3003489 RepID=A0A9E9C106_9STRA|nr:hypothetical protein [Amicula sp. isolate GU52X-4 cfCalB7]
MSNFTDFEELTETEKIMLGIAYNEGKKIGKYINNEISSGRLKVNESLEIIIDGFEQPFTLPRSHKILAEFSHPSVAIAGNAVLVGGGILLSAKSITNCLQTQNRVARVCYVISTCCSSAAAVSGVVTSFSENCGISQIAIMGDCLGGGFLYAGNVARDCGKVLEGKKKIANPFRNLRSRLPGRSKRVPKRYFPDRRVPFCPPCSVNFSILDNLPIEKIIVIGGCAITVYTYGKLLISVYKYGKQKAINFIAKRRLKKKIKNSVLIRKQALFLINSFSYTQSVNRIYNVALMSS